jgi:hypothetical protein
VKPRMTPERFWSLVQKSDGGCWEWTHSRASNGYGSFKMNYKHRLAHRYAWEITNGAIPAGALVCHRCDNPPCVNPDHLFLGDYSTNQLDAVAKGRHSAQTHRHRWARGSRHGTKTHPEAVARGERASQAKLTNERVLEIRAARASTGYGKRRLAAMFGVPEATVSLIIRRITWTHI